MKEFVRENLFWLLIILAGSLSIWFLASSLNAGKDNYLKTCQQVYTAKECNLRYLEKPH